MRIHLTCMNPTRSLVIALNGLRVVLARSGHAVSMSWPEMLEDEAGEMHLGFDRSALATADVIIHAARTGEIELPDEVRAAVTLGKPVIRYEPSGADEISAGEATLGVSRIEDIPRAIARAAAATVKG